MTHKRFGYQWEKYSELDSNYESQFRKWISPVDPSFFVGKRVLDAGCGMGRNSYWALKYGAKEVVAFDYDQRTVKAAAELLKDWKNARVELCSIYSARYLNEFDFVFSNGVIHHLESPGLGIESLVKAAKKGGKVLIWVYGYEGNEWIVRFVSPIRKLITSRLPPWLLNFLTYLVSVPFFVLLKLISFKNLYFKQLKDFRFGHVHLIILDQLLPQVANYYKREEAIQLLANAGLDNVQVYPCNNNSWTIIGTKK